MLVIRQEQLDAMRAQRAARFEDRMVTHLRQVWPERWDALGETGARALIRAGIERARGYGMTAEHDVARYIDLMCAVRDDFDTDPRIPPWVAQLLTAPGLSGARKMDALWERAKRELRRMAALSGARG